MKIKSEKISGLQGIWTYEPECFLGLFDTTLSRLLWNVANKLSHDLTFRAQEMDLHLLGERDDTFVLIALFNLESRWLNVLYSAISYFFPEEVKEIKLYICTYLSNP